MKPPMMKNLLRKLVVDLPTLDECTIVPLKMLTLWYERCGKYYCSSAVGIQATEEEKRLTMTLFTRIFDALARRVYKKLNSLILTFIIKIIFFFYLKRLIILNYLARHCPVYQLLVVLYHRTIRIL